MNYFLPTGQRVDAASELISTRGLANTITRVTGIPVRVDEVTEEQFWTPEYRASVFDEMWLQYVPPFTLPSSILEHSRGMVADTHHDGLFCGALVRQHGSRDCSKEISSRQRLLQVHDRRLLRTSLRRTKRYAISWGSPHLNPNGHTENGGRSGCRSEKDESLI